MWLVFKQQNETALTIASKQETIWDTPTGDQKSLLEGSRTRESLWEKGLAGWREGGCYSGWENLLSKRVEVASSLACVDPLEWGGIPRREGQASAKAKRWWVSDGIGRVCVWWRVVVVSACNTQQAALHGPNPRRCLGVIGTNSPSSCRASAPSPGLLGGWQLLPPLALEVGLGRPQLICGVHAPLSNDRELVTQNIQSDWVSVLLFASAFWLIKLLWDASLNVELFQGTKKKRGPGWHIKLPYQITHKLTHPTSKL